MDLKKAFGEALRKIRACRGLTQEDFSSISSRTYLSALERGVYSPTVEKLDALSSVLRVHPITLLAACYMNADPDLSTQALLHRLEYELREIDSNRSDAQSKA